MMRFFARWICVCKKRDQSVVGPHLVGSEGVDAVNSWVTQKGTPNEAAFMFRRTFGKVRSLGDLLVAAYFTSLFSSRPCLKLS